MSIAVSGGYLDVQARTVSPLWREKPQADFPSIFLPVCSLHVFSHFYNQHWQRLANFTWKVKSYFSTMRVHS